MNKSKNDNEDDLEVVRPESEELTQLIVVDKAPQAILNHAQQINMSLSRSNKVPSTKTEFLQSDLFATARQRNSERIHIDSQDVSREPSGSLDGITEESPRLF